MSGKKRDICDIFGSVYSKQRVTKGHKKTKYSVVDESASDGYDQCGRLVIQTENDCFEKTDSTASFNSNDTTEKWMKNKTEKLGNDEQICQIDIGNDCYVVGKVFGGNMLIHIRQYARRSDGTLFPTKKGIALDLEKWKKLCCKQNFIDGILDEYREKKPVDYMSHLGKNYYVSVKSGFSLLNIQGWFIPEGQQELVATKTGIALTFQQWEKVKDAMIVVEDLLDGELDNVVICEETHQNQMGALTCSSCNPNDYMNH